MWLLLVAAGTGYLARYWQKSGKFKTGPHIFKYNAALHSSQGSSPCTTRRGRSTTMGRRGLRKRSQSASGVSRKVLHGRKEGRLATTHARDLDENRLSSHNVCDESLCGKDFCGQCAFDCGTPGQVQTGSHLSWKHHLDLLLSSTTVCAQDLLREASFGMEKPFLPTAEVDAKEHDRLLFCNCVLPIEKCSLNGGPTTRVDFVENQVEGVTLSSRNCLDHPKPAENALLVGVSNRQLVLGVLACPEFVRVKTMGEGRRRSLPLKLKESTKQPFRFFAKLARGFGQRTYSKISNGMGRTTLNTRNAPVFKYLAYGKPPNSILSEEKKKKQGFVPYFVHSQHLKALRDPEIFDQSRQCTFLPFSSSAYDLEEATAYSSDFTGLSMAHVDKLSDWDHSLEKVSESVKPANLFVTSKFEPSCAGENHLRSSNVSFVALGLAMGVLLVVTTGRNNELEDLHKLIKENNTLIEELRKWIDFRIELDPSKLPEVEKVPSGLTMANETCSQKAHLHLDISSCQSAGENDCLELFNASDNHEANECFESHAHGFEDLEAELEAELELMELNGCNTDREWKWTQLDQGWQPQGDENGYSDKPEGDDTSYVDIVIHDSIAIQDAGQVYDSDFVVPPLELERRLWQVLEQRHEERICELENDLHATQEEVTAKEMEIKWWKDRVSLLMESLEGKSEGAHPLRVNQ